MDPMTPNQIYTAMEKRREELDLSHAQVAAKAGMHAPNVVQVLARIPRADRPPPEGEKPKGPDVRLSTLFKMAKALKLRVELVKED